MERSSPRWQLSLRVLGAFVVAQILTHPPEDTAKFLPEETAFYASLNLRPGVDQLTQAVDVLDRFKENPEFESEAGTSSTTR